MIVKRSSLFVLFLFTIVFAQSAVELPSFTSGSYNAASDGTAMSGSIGQTFTENFSSDAVVISSGLWGSVSSLLLGIDNIMPLEFSLSKAYPNPFNPTVNIDFSIPEAADVNINIFDLMGRLIFTHKQNFNNPGEYKFKWNGLSYDGIPIASGIYLININHKSNFYQQTITFLK